MSEEFDRQEQETGQTYETSDKAENEDAKRLDWLVREGEWDRLRHNATFMKLSVERRITKALDAVRTRIGQNERVFYEVASNYPVESGDILDKRVKPLRRLKKALGVCLTGDFDKVKDDVREKVNNVLGINGPDKPNKPQLKSA